MPSWIEPPPKQRRTGCLGKGCLMLVIFLILLAVAFFVGGYVGGDESGASKALTPTMGSVPSCLRCS